MVWSEWDLHCGSDRVKAQSCAGGAASAQRSLLLNHSDYEIGEVFVIMTEVLV